jgi:hypothetical protein
MSRDEVLSVMPAGSIQTYQNQFGHLGGGRDMRIPNPYRTAYFQIPTGRVEVIYYYTDVLRRDGVVTYNELTPLLLENDALVGWGWHFVEANAKKYHLDMNPQLRFDRPPL